VLGIAICREHGKESLFNQCPTSGQVKKLLNPKTDIRKVTRRDVLTQGRGAVDCPVSFGRSGIMEGKKGGGIRGETSIPAGQGRVPPAKPKQVRKNESDSARSQPLVEAVAKKKKGGPSLYQLWRKKGGLGPENGASSMISSVPLVAVDSSPCALKWIEANGGKPQKEGGGRIDYEEDVG